MKAKGIFSLTKRALSIVGRYSLGSTNMDQALQHYARLLIRFECGATFPITALTLKRHSDIIVKHLGDDIEFAVHGYTHVDYSHIEPQTLLAHLQLASAIFDRDGIKPLGFRSPYLRQNDNLIPALEATGFSYVSNQPIVWNVLDCKTLSPGVVAGYQRALAFYNPWQSYDRLSLPKQNGELIEIPVALPDDEILIDRIGGGSDLIQSIWISILMETYQRGELFTLQLHPERIALCADALSTVLAKAKTLTPKVWLARLDEIASWWKARTMTKVEISGLAEGGYRCKVTGPSGTTVLARWIEVDVPTKPWMNGYRVINATNFTFRSRIYPIIGISPSASFALVSFLRQQGFIVEISHDRRRYPFYFDQTNFEASQEQFLLEQIEGSHEPLIRLARWPNSTQSALAITGDVDALTLWDYGLRLVGR